MSSTKSFRATRRYGKANNSTYLDICEKTMTPKEFKIVKEQFMSGRQAEKLNIQTIRKKKK